jgi:hypothetical protein
VDESKPWERQPGEPAMWFDRFDRYFRPLGPERSLLAAYNAWRKEAQKSATKSVAKSWEKNARKWHWPTRTEAWDDTERQRRHAEEEAERLQARRERRRLLQVYRGKLEQALETLKPGDAKWAEVTAGLRMANEELRNEYDDRPTQRHEHELSNAAGEALASARRMLGPNRPFDLGRHRYLVPIYADDCQEMVQCKAGQIGTSEYLISWLLWSADERKATGLYVFPTDSHVSDFSAARLGPAIESEVSPYLAQIVVPSQIGGPRGADRVGLKRIGDRFIYFRGAKVQPDGRAPQLRSIDADALILDEFDEMDRRAPPIARERLGHSSIGDVRIASTPTFANVGVHAEYLASDQRTWHVRCTACGRWQGLTIDDLVIEWDDLGRPVAGQHTHPWPPEHDLTEWPEGTPLMPLHSHEMGGKQIERDPRLVKPL